jgi:hypothetical protein
MKLFEWQQLLHYGLVLSNCCVTYESGSSTREVSRDGFLNWTGLNGLIWISLLERCLGFLLFLMHWASSRMQRCTVYRYYLLQNLCCCSAMV